MVEFHDYFSYKVDQNLGLYFQPSDNLNLDICYVQEETPSTVDAIWGKIAEPGEAVKITSATNSSVSKYIRQNLACYSIESRGIETNDAISSKGVQLEGEIKSSDGSSKELKIVLHSTNTLPSDTSSEMVTLPRIYAGERKDLMITLNYLPYKECTLPAPYETNCKWTDGYSRSKCIEKCIDARTKLTFGQETTSYFVTVMNKSTQALTKQLNSSEIRLCKSQCGHYDCITQHFVPIIQSVVPNTGDKVILLESSALTLIQRSVPSLSVSELFSNIIFNILFWTMISPIPLLVSEATIKTLFRSELEGRKMKRISAMSIDEDKGNNNVTPVTNISNAP